MGEHTPISWCDHTFNPWWSCTEISPACDNCYAREWAKRFGVLWGAGQPRRPASERTWAEPLKWNRKAGEAGERRRVFCASMADIFDNEAPEGARERLWELIRATPSLDWLLLTKRIGNASKMLPTDWGDGYLNAWLGATIANQEEADRDIPKLLATPARIRFLSCEPILGAINLRALRIDEHTTLDALTGCHSGTALRALPLPPILPPIDWVIGGGESGRKARPTHPDWARALRDQCSETFVPFHWKQWGAYLPSDQAEARNYAYDEYSSHDWGDGIDSIHLKKKQSGRTLDGREWNEFPRSPT